MAMSVQLQSVRFAEIADIVLPRVSEPLMAMYDGAQVVFAEMPVTVRPVTVPVRLKPDATYEESSAPNAPNAPSLSARTFAGAYDASTFAPTAHIASVDKPNAPSNPWVEIGSATKKTSLGIASAFTRAGVSLARSF
jgi:hypothetical protein